MNRKNILLVVMILLSACGGESPKPEEQKPLSLAMDLPKTESNLKKSNEELGSKPLPEIKKSDLEFKVDQAAIKKKIAENPVKDETSCLNLVAPLQKRVDAIQRDEGMWGYIERVPDLRPYSAIGMQLDSKVNTMMAAARHICKTAHGVPYTALAASIDKGLEEKGEAKLKEEWVGIGESPTNIEMYLQYGAFAKAAKARVLDYSSIQQSIYWTEMFVDKYEEFAKRLAEQKSLQTALSDILALHDAVIGFLEADKIMVVAVQEEMAIPPLFMKTL